MTEATEDACTHQGPRVLEILLTALTASDLYVMFVKMNLFNLTQSRIHSEIMSFCTFFIKVICTDFLKIIRNL